MISIEKAKELLKDKNIPDDKVLEIITDSYVLAKIVIDEFIEKKEQKTKIHHDRPETCL